MRRSLALFLLVGGSIGVRSAHAQHTFAFYYSGAPIAISDGPSGCTSGCGPIASAGINVNFTSFPISWVRVSTQIDHTYQGDLHLEVYRQYSNQDVVLMDRPGSSTQVPCGFSADNLGIDPGNTFDFGDAGATTYDTPWVAQPGITSPTGLWQSENTLVGLNTYDTYGPWWLYAQDCAGGDTGHINTFAIVFNCPWGEFEPNETKAQATNIGYYPLEDGEPVTGYTRGTDTSGGGITTEDTLLVLPATAHAPALYRHRLDVSARARGVATNDYTASLLGLAQSAGVIQAGEATVQSAYAPVDQPRFVQWYQLRDPDFVFFRVSGSANTGASYYAAAMQTDPVTVIDAGTFAQGSIIITTVGLTTTDTDLWVLDANLMPMPGFGNDDSQGTTQSTLTRNYQNGTYYLAISDYNLAPSLASPPDDNWRNGPVVDYSHVIACSSSLENQNLTFRISDSAGRNVTVPATKAGAYDVLFYRFVVSNAPPPCYANCDGSTAPPILNVNDFVCFQNRFAAGDPYANCDGSTAPPVLNVNDFVCFQNQFAAGCP